MKNTPTYARTHARTHTEREREREREREKHIHTRTKVEEKLAHISRNNSGYSCSCTTPTPQNACKERIECTHEFTELECTQERTECMDRTHRMRQSYRKGANRGMHVLDVLISSTCVQVRGWDVLICSTCTCTQAELAQGKYVTVAGMSKDVTAISLHRLALWVCQCAGVRALRHSCTASWACCFLKAALALACTSASSSSSTCPACHHPAQLDTRASAGAGSARAVARCTARQRIAPRRAQPHTRFPGQGRGRQGRQRPLCGGAAGRLTRARIQPATRGRASGFTHLTQVLHIHRHGLRSKGARGTDHHSCCRACRDASGASAPAKMSAPCATRASSAVDPTRPPAALAARVEAQAPVRATRALPAPPPACPCARRWRDRQRA